MATSMDGVNVNIPEHFRSIYSNLYNSVDDADNMAKVSTEVEENIGPTSLSDVEKVTPTLIK